MPDLVRSGVHWLCPDWRSLRCLTGGDDGDGESAAPYATVTCWICETCPGSEEKWICPRYALLNVLRAAEERFGLRFLVGFEVEFVILQPSGDATDDERGILLASAHSGHYAAAGTRDATFRHVERSVRNLVAAGVKIQDFHIEGMSGQYEIALAPLAPMQAVDELVRVHDIIKRTVAAGGCIAIMMPRPCLARQSTGEHTHISLQPGNNSRTEESFLAGILRWLPATCAVTLPYAQSYCRVGKLEAGDRAAWGTENRDVAVRKIKESHWEIRCADATANMYLGLATLLAAGLEGVESRGHSHWRTRRRQALMISPGTNFLQRLEMPWSCLKRRTFTGWSNSWERCTPSTCETQADRIGAGGSSHSGHTREYHDNLFLAQNVH